MKPTITKNVHTMPVVNNRVSVKYEITEEIDLAQLPSRIHRLSDQIITMEFHYEQLARDIETAKNERSMLESLLQQKENPVI